MKVEIDITEEVEKAIEKEVSRQLESKGILGFARECIKEEFANSGSKKQLNRHEQQIVMMKKKLDALVGKGVA